MPDKNEHRSDNSPTADSGNYGTVRRVREFIDARLNTDGSLTLTPTETEAVHKLLSLRLKD